MDISHGVFTVLCIWAVAQALFFSFGGELE